MQDVLEILIDQPYTKYSVTELAALTGANQGAISKAIGLLDELDAVESTQW